MFLISTAVYVIFNAIFVVFGSAEVQPWNTYWDGGGGGGVKCEETPSSPAEKKTPNLVMLDTKERQENHSS